MAILTDNLRDFAKGYFATLSEIMAGVSKSLDVEEGIIAAAELITEKLLDGGCLYMCGNGGSAALANHMAIDIGKIPCSVGRLRAISLSSNTSVITAHGNDDGYESVFINQLEGIVSTDDVVLVISGSGNSVNVFEVTKYCCEYGIPLIALVGFGGGIVKQHIEFYGKQTSTVIHLEHNDMQICEDAFSAILHCIYRMSVGYSRAIMDSPELAQCFRRAK